MHHLVMRQRHNKPLGMLVKHGEGQFIVMVPPMNGILGEVAKGVMHPPHIPLEGKPQSILLRRAGVTRPAQEDGLGFTFKWNMGWMHDTLGYFAKDPIHRRHHHNELTFAMLYEHTERFIMPLSHDEVVHGKGSLLGKMPGDEWQKFANLRLLLTYMYTRPGKQLLFMGTELAPVGEWNHEVSLDWPLGREPYRAGLARFLETLGR